MERVSVGCSLRQGGMFYVALLSALRSSLLYFVPLLDLHQLRSPR